MELSEKTVESAVVYDGTIVRVRRDGAALPGGKKVSREVVEHPGGVAVLPLDQDENVVAVRQFRYPLMREMTEVPAGKLERGEDHRECAVRELGEETGLLAGELTYLGAIYPSPGFCDEILYLYLARNLTQGASHPDDDELLNIEKIPFAEFIERIENHEIEDAKTVVAALRTKMLLGL